MRFIEPFIILQCTWTRYTLCKRTICFKYYITKWYTSFWNRLPSPFSVVFFLSWKCCVSVLHFLIHLHRSRLHKKLPSWNAKKRPLIVATRLLSPCSKLIFDFEDQIALLYRHIDLKAKMDVIVQIWVRYYSLLAMSFC